MPSICAKCGGTQRGVCSRPSPYCTRCCRTSTLTDGYLCPGHEVRHAAAHPHHGVAAAVQQQQPEDNDVKMHPQVQPDTEEKYSTSSQSHSQPHEVKSSSHIPEDDVPSYLRQRPTNDTLFKALSKLKPWQKGVIQDGLEISCRAFVVQFERALDSVNAKPEDYLRLIPMWLTGEAVLWHDNLQESNRGCPQTWKEFKEALLQTYGDRLHPPDAWQYLLTCDLKANESLEAHADRFRHGMVQLQNVIPDWMCYDEYIKKMRPITRWHLGESFDEEIRKGVEMKGVTLDKITREAIRFESRFGPNLFGPNPFAHPLPPNTTTSSTSTQSVAVNRSQGSNSLHWSVQRDNKKRPRDSQSPTNQQDEKPPKQNTGVTKDRSHVTCWNCGQRGHFKNRCPEPPKESNVKQEHKSRDGPKDKDGARP
jgi:hypothetical protein